MAVKPWIMVCVGLILGGCAVRLSERGDVSPGTFAARIAANSHDHKRIIELARSTTDERVFENGRLVAEWLPLWPGGRAEKELPETKDIIFREKGHNHEVLVIHDLSDITVKEMGRASYIEDIQGHHDVYIALTEEGSKSISSMTESHLPDDKTGFQRRVAMIVTGQVYSLPRIQAVVYDRVVISAVSKDDAEKIEALLNGMAIPAKANAAKVTEPIGGVDKGAHR